jgi:hypothetical protein
MLMTKKRRPAIRTLRGWAISVLQEAGAIRECEEHGWLQDRADPDARARALDIAGQHPPAGVSRDEAIAEIKEVLDSIGDTCPECPPRSANKSGQARIFLMTRALSDGDKEVALVYPAGPFGRI